MSSENIHHRDEKRRYTFFLVPNDESKKTRTISFGVWGFIGTVVIAFGVISILSFVALEFSPLRTILSSSSPEMERQTQQQMLEIQQQVNDLLQEMVVLRQYNVKLREALGEKESTGDTTKIAQSLTDSPRQRFLDNPLPKTREVVKSADQTISGERPSDLERVVQDQDGWNLARGTSLSFPFAMPAQGYVSRSFDEQQHHYGVDLAGNEGSPVWAAGDGQVVFSGWTYNDGFMMVIAHAEGFVTVYKHNRSLMKETGVTVKRGDVIALLGNTGKTSSGPHLHFEVWKDGNVQDPSHYLLNIQ